MQALNFRYARERQQRDAERLRRDPLDEWREALGDSPGDGAADARDLYKLDEAAE